MAEYTHTLNTSFFLFFFVFSTALGYVTYRQKAKVYWEREARLKQLLDQGNDEWEVPRNNVVINRQIGEGAFGIVNGGDAQFEVDGRIGGNKTMKTK